MPIDTNVLTPEKQQQAGHYEVLGETYAAFELFENGWNPYSRFLDVDKVDFILRKLLENKPIPRREIENMDSSRFRIIQRRRRFHRELHNILLAAVFQKSERLYQWAYRSVDFTCVGLLRSMRPATRKSPV